MTIERLIEILKQAPKDIEIEIYVSSEDKYYEIEGVDLYCNAPESPKMECYICTKVEE